MCYTKIHSQPINSMPNTKIGVWVEMENQTVVFRYRHWIIKHFELIKNYMRETHQELNFIGKTISLEPLVMECNVVWMILKDLIVFLAHFVDSFRISVSYS